MILKKAKTLCLPVVCCMALALVFFQAPPECYGDEIGIDVAPNVLNIQSQSQVVTVHTDIAYTNVVGSSVYLNDILIHSWKADDRGYFVAKFLMEDVKGLAYDDDGIPLMEIGGYNLLILVGIDTEGDDFSGAQAILVIDNIPVGTGKK